MERGRTNKIIDEKLDPPEHAWFGNVELEMHLKTMNVQKLCAPRRICSARPPCQLRSGDFRFGA
jgi:hypothetical protein